MGGGGTSELAAPPSSKLYILSTSVACPPVQVASVPFTSAHWDQLQPSSDPNQRKSWEMDRGVC